MPGELRTLLKFEIPEIKELDAESRRDNFRIRTIDRLEASGSFSNFRINELTDRINLKVDYGDLDIDKTAADFSSIYIEAKSTDINLHFDETSKFNFEITHTKSDLGFSNKLKIEVEKTIDEKEKTVEMVGYFGAKATNTKLNIRANSGEINIFSN